MSAVPQEGKLASGWKKLPPMARTAIAVGGIFTLSMIAAAMIKDDTDPATRAAQSKPAPTTNLVMPNRRDITTEALASRIDSNDQRMGNMEQMLKRMEEMQRTLSDQQRQQANEALRSGSKLAAGVAAENTPKLEDKLPVVVTPPPPEPAPAVKQEPEQAPVVKRPAMRVIGSEPVEAEVRTGRRADIVERDPLLDTMMAGGMFEGVLINGMDAATSSVAQKNPAPVLIRVKTDAILPNRFTSDVRECFVIASGFGVLATERAQLRTETISCVRENGTRLEAKLDGYIIGEDGKAGMRGRLISKQGQMIAKSLLAGVLEGVGKGMTPQAVNPLQINPGSTAQTQMPNFGAVAQSGVMGGVSQAANDISKFYLDMAKEMFPVVEIDAGRKITIVILKGMSLEGKGGKS